MIFRHVLIEQTIFNPEFTCFVEATQRTVLTLKGKYSKAQCWALINSRLNHISHKRSEHKKDGQRRWPGSSFPHLLLLFRTGGWKNPSRCSLVAHWWISSCLYYQGTQGVTGHLERLEHQCKWCWWLMMLCRAPSICTWGWVFVLEWNFSFCVCKEISTYLLFQV